jgi:hypothetical protein
MAADKWEQLYAGSGSDKQSQPTTGPSANVPTTRLELSISCRGLRDCDIASKSDPQCFVSIRDSYQDKYYEVGRTEEVKNNLNPDFVKKVIVSFNFEMVQKIRFEVYDIDPVGKDFLGQMDTTLADIVAFKGKQFIKPLIGKNRNLNCGQIIVVVEEVIANKQSIYFQVNGFDIRRSLFVKRDTFLKIWKTNEDGTNSLVHKSENCWSSTEPSFKPISLKVTSLCGGDLDRSVRIDLVKHSYSGDHRLLGSIFTTVNQMVKGSSEENKYQLTKKSASTSKKRGRLEIRDVRLHEELSFVDFIRGGTELHFAVAVDYTASNGAPNDPRSLHYIFGQNSRPNAYEIALKSVGEIISHYDPKGMYASFGFGAIVGSDKVASHQFPLNGNPAHPYCNGVNDLISCYRNTLSRITLYGPTNFAPVIEQTSAIASQNEDGLNYFILLIITDGIICDMHQTKRAILKASQLPLSIIIVGVGSADFAAMSELDSDEELLSVDGRKCARDIVQFVAINRFLVSGGNHVHSMVDLAREVLFEVPDQVISYMKLKGFKPNQPRGNGPTAPSFNYSFS